MEELKTQLKQHLAELQVSSGTILAEISKTGQQIELIERLLRVSDSAGAAEENSPATPASAGDAPGEVIRQLLLVAGRPLHISEILTRYVATGNRVPGKGTETNLLSYMVRDPSFVRVAKGTYSLASGDKPLVIPGKRKKKRRKRRRKRARQTGTQIAGNNKTE